MTKLRAIVRLNDLGLVSKKANGSLNEINGRVAAAFFISVQESFPRSFFQARVLIKLGIFVNPYVAAFGDELHVDLPFYADLFRSVVRQCVPFLLLFLLGLVVSKAPQNAVKRDDMARVVLISPKLAIQLAEADIRVSAQIVGDLPDLFVGVGRRMRCFGTL